MYDFKTIESKWCDYWNKIKLYQTPSDPNSLTKFYLLEMFAYPSGDIHMGHFRNYTIGDAYWRYKKMLGADIMHPFGWDAFGLPAEEAAIKHKLHPREWTLNNISKSRKTLQELAISYDWNREVITCQPDYYKWTQWVFLQLYKKGLAYQADSAVNWCPSCKTVLANEQVTDNICWRCKSVITKRNLKQWFFKITEYAQRLLDDIDKLNQWPENIKTMQRNWIGRSEGCEIKFKIQNSESYLNVFTTRPDTIFGVTFIAVAPEHPLVEKVTKPEQKKAIEEYIKKSANKSDIERTTEEGEKDGVFTGSFAVNPLSGEKVYIFITDYVLSYYGTGVVMGVPAHDQRDYLFAKKYNLPIKVVINPNGKNLSPDSITEAYTEPGIITNSEQFNGLDSNEGIKKIVDYIDQKSIGKSKINYRLRDWLISRQRYWGAPIPMIHCPQCGVLPVQESDLPVLLPEVEDYIPKGRSPLADVPEFMNVKCYKCGAQAHRDPDTMDTFVCSSWYHLRYSDPKNDKKPFSKESVNKWLPVDLYIGGAEHACGHLIYFRFVTKVLHDIGYIDFDEPVKRLFNHGMVLDEKGEVMSKSKGNVISPIEIMNQYGVDVGRLAMFFAAPSEAELLWNNRGLVGAKRFINRIYQLVTEALDYPIEINDNTKNSETISEIDALYSKTHQTIRQVTEDIEALHYNTAISAIMELVNNIYDVKNLLRHPSRTKNYVDSKSAIRKTVETTILLLTPLIPHMAEELWRKLGKDNSIHQEKWPVYNPLALKANDVEIVIQINGKIRSKVIISINISEEEVKKVALADIKIQEILKGQTPKKIIVIPEKLVNIVI
jgi:leucyl-tRNA synthetase